MHPDSKCNKELQFDGVTNICIPVENEGRLGKIMSVRLVAKDLAGGIAIPLMESQAVDWRGSVFRDDLSMLVQYFALFL